MKTVFQFVLGVFPTAGESENGNVGLPDLVAFTAPAEDNSPFGMGRARRLKSWTMGEVSGAPVGAWD